MIGSLIIQVTNSISNAQAAEELGQARGEEDASYVTEIK